ncbi:MAG: dihydroorotase family protein [Chloroflexota bacterium]
MHDLRVLNGLVVSDGETRRGDVAIDDGRISEIADAGGLGPGREEIDADGCYVLPGAVDVHFHCRAPSYPTRGDFKSETRAAAAGGVTTVLEMPISDPACSTPEVVRSRRELGERTAVVNFGLFAGGAVPDAGAAQALADAGAIAFKLFTTTAARGRESEFVGLCAPTDEQIFTALEAIRPTGLMCTVHAEDEALRTTLLKYGAAPETLDSPILEASAIAIVATIARATRTPIHFAHVTGRMALDAVRAAKASSGSDVSAETCPHYLLFDEETVRRHGGFAKVAPRLREADDRAALWGGLCDGTIDLIASDHAPFQAGEKSDGPFEDAPNGIPGVEMMMSIMLDGAARGALSLEGAVDMISAAPARRFGLFPRKGAVAVGSDADLCIYDPRTPRIVSTADFHSRSARSAVVYDGLTVQGCVVRTIVGGTTVFQDGQIVGSAGAFVAPAGSAS